MSLYNLKIKKVQDSIISRCKTSIRDNFNELDMWLNYEDWEFPTIYENEFNKEFSVYISQDTTTSDYIYYAGNNLTYFVITITSTLKSLDKINKLVEIFIKNQIDDFDNACDYISMTMYNENNPDISETNQPVVVNNTADDNPSNS